MTVIRLFRGLRRIFKTWHVMGHTRRFEGDDCSRVMAYSRIDETRDMTSFSQ